MKKIKIIYFIHGSFIEGGAFLSIFEIIKLISKNTNFEIHIFLPNDSSKKLIKNINKYCDNVYFYKKNLFLFFGRFLIGWTDKNLFINILRVFKDLLKSLIYIFFISKKIKKINPHIIHFNSSIFLPFSFFQTKIANIIIHNREGLRNNFLNKFRLKILKIISKKNIRIICISEVERNQYLDLLNLKNLIIIPNPINNIFNFQKINLDPKSFVISCFGGYDFKKGTFDILKSISDIDSLITLIICGPETGNQKYVQSIKKLISLLNKKKNIQIRLIGLTDNALNIIYQSDVVIVPHKYSHFSRVIIECFSLKRKIISYKDEYSSYLFKNTKGIYLTSQNNHYALKDKIIEIISNMNEIDLNANFLYWKNNHSPESSFKKMISLYSIVCQ